MLQNFTKLPEPLRELRLYELLAKLAASWTNTLIAKLAASRTNTLRAKLAASGALPKG